MEKIQELMDEVATWSQDTFNEGKYHPDRTMSMGHHLLQEVKELIIDSNKYHKQVTGSNYYKMRMEFADCFMLLFNMASNEGLTINDIHIICAEKLKINKARKWGKPDANGVVNHIKE